MTIENSQYQLSPFLIATFSMFDTNKSREIHYVGIIKELSKITGCFWK